MEKLRLSATLALALAAQIVLADPGKELWRSPDFEVAAPGADLSKAQKTIALKGSSEILLDAKKGDSIALTVGVFLFGGPLECRMTDPAGVTHTAALRDTATQNLSFPVSADGVCKLSLKTDTTAYRITLDARPAVIKTPVHIFKNGATLYFRPPADKSEFDVFAWTEKKAQSQAGIDIIAPDGKTVLKAELEDGGNGSGIAKAHVSVKPQDAGKIWGAGICGVSKSQFREAVASFSGDTAPYVSLSPETLMTERVLSPAEAKALYSPFIEELSKRLAAIPAGGAANYWKPALEARLKQMRDAASAAVTFEAREKLRAELLKLDSLAGALAKGKLRSEKCAVRSVKAVTDRRILPDEPLTGGVVGGDCMVIATPGEYESASFTVTPEEPLPGFMVTVSKLTSADGANIPTENIDVKSVKVWWQDTGRTEHGPQMGLYNYSLRSGRHALVPELLLHDDSLVRVDVKEKKNYVRTGRGAEGTYVCVSGPDPVPGKTMDDFYIADAATLKPLDLRAGENKQFWVTVHVPDNASAGVYEGVLSLSYSGGTLGTVPMKVRVLPFKFAPSRHIAGIYYYWPDKVYYGKSRMEQYRRELENMKAHSIDNSAMPFSVLEEPQAFEIRVSVLGPQDDIYYGGWSMHYAKTPEEMRETTEKHIKALSKFGHKNIWLYGLDEAEGEKLTAQRKNWETAHELGGKIYVAGYPSEHPERKGKKGNFDLAGDIQDMLVCAWEPSRAEAAKWHSKGHKILSYGNPQAGLEIPETYRRNFGLRLWQNDYDGLMTYLYHWGASFAQDWGKKPGPTRYFPCSWNDDCRKDDYRQHNMVYPTAEGVIDTLEWEGYREAADDLRYIDTLSAMTEEKANSKSPSLRAAAEKAQKFMAELKERDLSPDKADLDLIRAEIIDQILALQSAEASGK